MYARVSISFIFILFAFLSSFASSKNKWIEADSAEAISNRIERDFPYTVDEFYRLAAKENPQFTHEELINYIDNGLIEVMELGSEERVFRKALRNMKLLHDANSKNWRGRGANASEARMNYADSIIKWTEGKNPLGAGHRVVYKFEIDVPVIEELAFDTLRVWMPMPMNTGRQKNVKILDASHPDFVLSTDRSVHNSIFFEVPTGNVGDTIKFWYTAQFDTFGEYFSDEYILAHIKPYDTTSDLYRTYTALDKNRHIAGFKGYAREIVGEETNPFKMSEMVYDHIVENFPWAGAREYSTIDCIPAYVLDCGHGDCGQVALLYISLMRSLGIPARWESGWMLHPGEKNLHDWAEVYFEGVGWVPVDVSFGRYSSSKDNGVRNFYSHGIDSYRLAANRGISGEFFPPKRFIRSETVDAQMGEVESNKGNLFYPLWDQNLEIISIEPISSDKKHQNIDMPIGEMGLVTIPVATIRTEPSQRAEICTQAVLGMPVKIVQSKSDWLEVMTAEGYTGWVPDSSIKPLQSTKFDSWRRSDMRRVVASLKPKTVYKKADSTSDREVLTDLVLGSIVEVDAAASLAFNPLGRVPVVLPDGRRGWTDAELIPFDEWANQEFDADKILDTAYSMEGTPYLWGGTSTNAIDCSGLVKVSYLNNGLILKRDASQQAKTGLQLDPSKWTEYEPADLLFFGNASTGKITHVGIYDSDSRYVHSSGRVKRNSLDPSSPDYLYSPLKAVRINGMIGTEGIIPVASHPWFFATM